MLCSKLHGQIFFKPPSVGAGTAGVGKVRIYPRIGLDPSSRIPQDPCTPLPWCCPQVGTYPRIGLDLSRRISKGRGVDRSLEESEQEPWESERSVSIPFYEKTVTQKLAGNEVHYTV